MKNTMMILGLMVQLAAFGQAANAGTNSVNVLLPNIVNRVTNCSVNPFSVSRDGQKTFHELKSHCPEVAVTAPGVAKIKVDSHIFQATIVETENSDGDLYNVTIKDVRSGDQATFENVLAFGDVLLGVLQGDNTHVFAQEISESEKSVDANLLRKSY